MIRWFGYGFMATIGVYAACALTALIDERKRSGDEHLFI